MIFNVKAIKKPADPAYKDLHTLEFNHIMLGCGPYIIINQKQNFKFYLLLKFLR